MILQDLVMPEVNGLDLLKEYRNDPFTRAIPVIVLSSKEDPAIKQTAFESGANDPIRSSIVLVLDSLHVSYRTRLVPSFTSFLKS